MIEDIEENCVSASRRENDRAAFCESADFHIWTVRRAQSEKSTDKNASGMRKHFKQSRKSFTCPLGSGAISIDECTCQPVHSHGHHQWHMAVVEPTARLPISWSCEAKFVTLLS